MTAHAVTMMSRHQGKNRQLRSKLLDNPGPGAPDPPEFEGHPGHGPTGTATATVSSTATATVTATPGQHAQWRGG